MDSVVQCFRPDEFKTFFRLSKASVEYLIETITRVSTEEGVEGILADEHSGGIPPISLDKRVLLFLWFICSLDKYASIADRFGVCESTACSSIHNLLGFVKDHLTRKLIKWPTPGEQTEISDMFMDLYDFPGVQGMIDGTHIQIRPPSERGIDYYNRKDYYSVVLQACVREAASQTPSLDNLNTINLKNHEENHFEVGRNTINAQSN